MRSNISETLCWQGGVTLDGKRYALFSNAEHQLRIMAIVDIDDGGERHEVLEPVADAPLIARIKSKWQQQ
ncbi:hypothetical protein [Pseudoramibacter alactolyticus]|jgi:hypothetical protein|uniref:hypothetical protein n=1 Tax=Pseudoramibacter alactolyticus TaxID=113287 RepID=UPI002357D9E6|nr:hypothetical protein [Pseudoramibacter alactolyticus]MBM6967687.1 hypothetical protein [Pseudoramibacter alactolyticus]